MKEEDYPGAGRLRGASKLRHSCMRPINCDGLKDTDEFVEGLVGRVK